MSDLRDKNRAVQSCTFPSSDFSQAVREWIAAATERMEGASEGGKVEADWHPCKNCGQLTLESPDRPLYNDHLCQYTCKPASEPAKVECPNCGEPEEHYLFQDDDGAHYSCKPAQPEPVAEEMPEAVSVNTWQLEELLKYADLAEVSIRTGFAPPSFLGVDLPYLLRNAIAAVRAQAAEAGIKLPKVREGISLLIWKIDNAQGDIAVEHYSEMLRSMMAELDAAEGRK